MITAHAQAFLIIVGVLTAGILAFCIAPDALVKRIFGEDLTPSGRLITRHWGLLIGGVGVLLILAAFHPATRGPILVFAVVEKLAIAVLVLASPFRHRALPTLIAAADALMALVCIAILAGL